MKRLLHPFSVLSLGLGLSQLPLRAQDAAPANPPPSPPADGGGARRNPAQMMQQLKDRLGLSDDQARQLAQIFQEMRTQGQALRQDASLADDDRRAKGQALMKATHDKIRAMLTADQQQIFDAMPPMLGPGRRPPPPPAN
jgi:periplasmic protein CpxP/Spy